MFFPQSQFESFLSASDVGPAELLAFRKKAYTRFKELGFPNRHWEDWQFTNFSALEKRKFEIYNEPLNTASFQLNIPFQENAYNLIFVNGVFKEDMSTIPPKVQFQPFGKKFPNLYSFLVPDTDLNPFQALNSAFFNSGFLLDIPPDTELDQPLNIFYLSTKLSQTTMSHPRFQFILGKNSQAEIIEHYLGQTRETYWNNVSTVIKIGENAALKHTRLQEEGSAAYHTGSTTCELGKSSRLNSSQIAIGGKLFRHNLKISFKGDYAKAVIKGLSLTSKTQHTDTNIQVEHARPHCTSMQLFKNVLADGSNGVFTGRVLVREGSHKTDAGQSSKNLLLSEKARMFSNPQLEIYADDVKCAHGSTTGQLDADALFYFRSRGLSQKTAKRILVKGFADEVLRGQTNKSLLLYLEQQLDSWLNGISRA
ncbi:MAG: Fe-S cluster assembly protein SufD [Candidatus Neomarinimicrobiota bacterium]